MPSMPLLSLESRKSILLMASLCRESILWASSSKPPKMLDAIESGAPKLTLVEALVMEADDPPSGLLCGSVVSAPPKSRAALDFFFSFSAASYAVLHLG